MLEGTLHDLLYISTCVILLSMGLIISMRSHAAYQTGRKYLALYFWAYFLTVAISLIVLKPNLLVSIPHVARTAMLFFLLIMPFSYLYVRENLGNLGVRWKDAWCFLPALLYIVDYTPFFLKSGAEKLAIMQSLNAVNIRSGYQEGWLIPPLAWGWLRCLFFGGFWLAQGHLIYKYFYLGGQQTAPGRRTQRSWFIWLQLTQLFIFLPSLILYIVDRRDLVVIIGNIGALVVAGMQGYFLLFKPEILYGFSTASQAGSIKESKSVHGTEYADLAGESDEGEEGLDEGIPAYTILLDECTLDEIGKTIEGYFARQPAYLDPSFKISSLASSVGLPSHKLSAYFSRRLNMGFKDYINRLRIESSIRKFEMGEHQDKTLEAISLESGFQSRSTFIRAFKKFRGMTPSAFLEK